MFAGSQILKSKKYDENGDDQKWSLLQQNDKWSPSGSLKSILMQM